MAVPRTNPIYCPRYSNCVYLGCYNMWIRHPPTPWRIIPSTSDDEEKERSVNNGDNNNPAKCDTMHASQFAHMCGLNRSALIT